MTFGPAGMAALAPTATILLPCTTTSPGEAQAAAASVEQVRGLEHGDRGRRGAAAGVCALAAKASNKAAARPRDEVSSCRTSPSSSVSPECMTIRRTGNCGRTAAFAKDNPAKLSPLGAATDRWATGDEPIRLDGGARLPARAGRRWWLAVVCDVVDLAVQQRGHAHRAGAVREVDPAVSLLAALIAGLVATLRLWHWKTGKAPRCPGCGGPLSRLHHGAQGDFRKCLVCAGKQAV